MVCIDFLLVYWRCIRDVLYVLRNSIYPGRARMVRTYHSRILDECCSHGYSLLNTLRLLAEIYR